MLGDSFDVRALLPNRSGVDGDNTTSSDSITNNDDTSGCCDCCDMLPTLSWQERLLGCATCMIAGYMLSFGSFLRVLHLLSGNPIPFVLTATVGNILALCGSCFLSGPKSQLQKMWHTTRRVATIVYLTSMILTLVVAIIPMPSNMLRKLLLLLLILCQYVSIFWYCLSYIPFAREALKRYCCHRLDSINNNNIEDGS